MELVKGKLINFIPGTSLFIWQIQINRQISKSLPGQEQLFKRANCIKGRQNFHQVSDELIFILMHIWHQIIILLNSSVHVVSDLSIFVKKASTTKKKCCLHLTYHNYLFMLYFGLFMNVQLILGQYISKSFKSIQSQKFIKLDYTVMQINRYSKKSCQKQG